MNTNLNPFFIASLLFLTSCQTIERDKTSDDIKVDLLMEGAKQEKETYENAIKPYQEYNYSKAIEALQDYLKKFPLSENVTRATFMLADSYFQLANYQSALQWYKKVIEFNKGQKKSTADALYKLGLCYEYLGEDTKAIAAYLDALKRKEKLSFELYGLEIPARLALSYMRQGELRSAQKYFLITESGITRVRKKLLTYRDKSAWLAQILYQMGSMSFHIKTSPNIDNNLLSLDHVQDYLLFAAELNDPKWSDLAATEIFNVYETAFNIIQKMEPENKADRALARHEQILKQNKFSNDLLDNIENLRDKITPETENLYIKTNLQRLDLLEKQIQQFIATNIQNSKLTEEAKKLEAPRREGH